MHFIRRTISRKESSKNERKPEAVEGEQDTVVPSIAHIASPSTATSSSSLSTLSTSSLQLQSPSPLFPTLHVCTLQPSESSITLRLHSRARSANQTPLYFGGDNISGDVMMNFPEKEVQHVTSVDVEASDVVLSPVPFLVSGLKPFGRGYPLYLLPVPRHSMLNSIFTPQLYGETLAVGSSKPNRFLSRKLNIWSSTDARGPRASLSMPYLKTSKSFSDYQTVSDLNRDPKGQSTPTTPGFPPSSFIISRTPTTLGRSASSAGSIFGSIRRSQADIRSNVTGTSNVKVSRLRDNPRRQLEASRTYVWPFELKLPQRVSSSAGAAKTLVPPVPPVTEVREEQSSVDDQEQKGGVRAELTGYGVGWNDVSFVDKSESPPFSAGEKLKVKGDDEENADRKIFLETSIGMEKKDLDPVLEPPVDEQFTFQLPPSFSETASPAYLGYKLIVSVKMRGAFRDNSGLQKGLLVQSHSYADPVPHSRTQASPENTDISLLLGPEQYPEGWKLMPPVVMQVHPKGRRAVNFMMTCADMNVELQLAIARPLSYARGSSIPVRVIVSIPQCLAVPVKGKKDKARPSTSPTSFPGQHAMFSPPPFAIGAVPHKHKHTVSEGKPTLFPVPHTPDVTKGPDPTRGTSCLPSAATIASSIRLVRAIYVGEGASDEGRRVSSASFLRTVSRAVILEDGPDGADVPILKIEGDIKDEGAGPKFKGWIPERGRLVKSFSGEIPLDESLKASFVFPQFVLRYAVVLSPFDAPTFTPLSTEPLWSETVTIATDPAKIDFRKGHTSRAASLSAAVPLTMPEGSHRTVLSGVKREGADTGPIGQEYWQDAFGTLSTTHAVPVGLAARGFTG